MNEIKIAVLGSEGVGKSALIVRFFTKRFIGEYASASECIYRKRLTMDGKQMNLELYEPSSQSFQVKLTLNDQIHWADGFIVVYDISDRSSFLAARSLVKHIRERRLGSAKRDAESLIFVVGNKRDLCHMREVGCEEGRRLAGEFRCQFHELSAAEHHQEVALIFSKAVQSAGGKGKASRRRSSGSKSVAKLINNVFGKRRKSV
ncbi:ras-related and estrogen-regulated growth inhibitor-like protein [Syngnathoides biaculeatus]|uniref:ras-related and estrogen-regulated growth inhibitor-like protein n=1 Tax=Syngnathoides biaculeatus TaxID=300417 RepID=UPI002ADE4FF8|nr:ras-related and estrogen-regulated growth inhibitor-like protein [Syngnathoides biaculeatus]XP_061663800.1 ras-related and estrogen-regulated growth inhibitor-like protein [Syngnathoides biaculeatus]